MERKTKYYNVNLYALVCHILCWQLWQSIMCCTDPMHGYEARWNLKKRPPASTNLIFPHGDSKKSVLNKTTQFGLVLCHLLHFDCSFLSHSCVFSTVTTIKALDSECLQFHTGWWCGKCKKDACFWLHGFNACGISTPNVRYIRWLGGYVRWLLSGAALRSTRTQDMSSCLPGCLSVFMCVFKILMSFNEASVWWLKDVSYRQIRNIVAGSMDYF